MTVDFYEMSTPQLKTAIRVIERNMRKAFSSGRMKDAHKHYTQRTYALGALVTSNDNIGRHNLHPKWIAKATTRQLQLCIDECNMCLSILEAAKNGGHEEEYKYLNVYVEERMREIAQAAIDGRRQVRKDRRLATVEAKRLRSYNASFC